MLAIGLMSGTSLDGVDAAVLETDGLDRVEPRGFCSLGYDDADRKILRAATAYALTLDRPTRVEETVEVLDRATEVITRTHVAAVQRLLVTTGLSAAEIDLVGFHGQTVAHRPDRGWTWQLGDGAVLARRLGIEVVDQLRVADVEAGGEGAPLLPAYHRARLAGRPQPTVVLNLGGIANVTYVHGDADPIAFDTGPANGLLDDWVAATVGGRYDEGGRLAATGSVDDAVLARLLDHPYFDRPAPKSLDRADFGLDAVSTLSPGDGAATLTAFTAAGIALALALLPTRARRIVVAGGGRHNPVMMAMIGDVTGLPVQPVETLGWDGDATEAEGFGYLAVRSIAGLPITFPTTTGVATALSGGRRLPAAGGPASRP